MALEISINRDLCMGSGNCAYWCPEVFDIDDENVAIMIGDPAAHEGAVHLSAENCPTSAISLKTK